MKKINIKELKKEFKRYNELNKIINATNEEISLFNHDLIGPTEIYINGVKFLI